MDQGEIAARCVLAGELGIEPGPALANLEERILLQDPALLELPDSATSTVYELPPPTEPIIGRDADIQQAMSLLAGRRQLTILGPGGVGKTSVAVTLATRVADRYPGGVAFVDLSAVTNPRLVGPSIASIDTDVARGSGVLIDTGIILTAAHVAGPWQ